MSTIRDIARQLGVAPSTVSRALTDASGVSEKTKMLVRETADKMNYSVNRHARNLVTRRSNLIGFMIPDISDSFFSKSAYGIEEALRNSEFEMVYTNVRRDPDNICAFLRRAEEYCYAGAFVTIDVWTDAVKAQLRAMQIPVISLRRQTPLDMTDVLPFVDSDHVSGTESFVGHLLQLGHKRVGYIGFDTPVGQLRAEAFRATAARKHLDYEEVSNFSYHNADIRISAGYRSAQCLLEAHPDLTALCAGDDQLAIGALQYLMENHYRVPEDISLVGYDDRDVAQLFCIQLTTVRQQLFEIGQVAGRMMLERIRNPQAPLQSMRVPTTLKIRRTTGAVRSESLLTR